MTDGVNNSEFFQGTSETESITLAVQSTPIPGMSPEEWLALYDAVDASSVPDRIHPGPDKATPILIDGHAGTEVVGCNLIDTKTWIGDRYYEIGGWGNDRVTQGANEDFRALFDAWLSTIKLDPASALVPTPAPPSPSSR